MIEICLLELRAMRWRSIYRSALVLAAVLGMRLAPSAVAASDAATIDSDECVLYSYSSYASQLDEPRPIRSRDDLRDRLPGSFAEGSGDAVLDCMARSYEVVLSRSRSPDAAVERPYRFLGVGADDLQIGMVGSYSTAGYLFDHDNFGAASRQMLLCPVPVEVSSERIGGSRSAIAVCRGDRRIDANLEIFMGDLFVIEFTDATESITIAATDSDIDLGDEESFKSFVQKVERLVSGLR